MFEQGIRLTANGIGTVFAILILLTLVIKSLGKLVLVFHSIEAAKTGASKDESAVESQDKALAAVVAVSAVLENRDKFDAQKD